MFRCFVDGKCDGEDDGRDMLLDVRNCKILRRIKLTNKSREKKKI